MTKAPIPTEMSKGQIDNTNNATKNFDYTAIADRPKTVSWINHIQPADGSQNMCLLPQLEHLHSSNITVESVPSMSLVIIYLRVPQVMHQVFISYDPNLIAIVNS